MNKEREIDGIKIVVNGEQYEAYKGTLQDKIKQQNKYIEMLQNNIEKLVEEKIELQDRIDSAIKTLEDRDYTDSDFESCRYQNDVIKILKGE